MPRDDKHLAALCHTQPSPPYCSRFPDKLNQPDFSLKPALQKQ